MESLQLEIPIDIEMREIWFSRLVRSRSNYATGQFHVLFSMKSKPFVICLDTETNVLERLKMIFDLGRVAECLSTVNHIIFLVNRVVDSDHSIIVNKIRSF